MKCNNKEIKVIGMAMYHDIKTIQPFTCLITNDEKGKTLSIDDGEIQFSINFDEIAEYLK